jgi:hypothetical protein
MRLLPRSPSARSLFGDAVIIAFLCSQALDGIFTYLGLRQFGPAIEANPLIGSVLPVLGVVATVASAKLIAAGFGIVLHVRGVHVAVAALTALYLAAAVAPWTAVLLLS